MEGAATGKERIVFSPALGATGASAFRPSQHRGHGSLPLRIARVTLLVLPIALFAGTAVAEERFSLIGTWEYSEAGTPDNPANTQTQTFWRDGRYVGKWTISPLPARQVIFTVVNWRGNYRITGATTITYMVQALQRCAMGSCVNWPYGDNLSKLAKDMGIEPGVQHQGYFQPKGPNRFVDSSNRTWRRVR
jgi:hypothetical protein